MIADPITSIAVLDVEGTLARLGGDRDLFSEMVGFVLEDAPPLVSKLQLAMMDCDAAEIERYAHAIKGLLMNGGGMRAAHAARLIENAAHANDWNKISSLLQTLAGEIDSMCEAMRKFLKRRSEFMK